jgi:hypothetical protein
MITFKDPTTNKIHAFKTNYVPLSRISPICNQGEHGLCNSDPQTLIQHFNLEVTKLVCCLCRCHSEGEAQI